MDSYNGIPSTQDLIEILLHTLTTGPGLLAVVGFLILLVAAAVSKKARWIAFGGVVYMGTFGFFWLSWFHHVLIPPLEIIRTQSRNIAIALMLVVCFGACFAGRGGGRRKLLIGATIAAFIFELAYCGRLMFGGWFTKGVFGVVLYALIFGAFGLSLSVMLQELKDVYSAIRCLAVAGTLLCLGTAVQLALNRDGVLLNGRLASTPGTATHTAEAIAVVLPAMVFLAFSKSEPRILRALWLSSGGALLIFLAMTGTRNGVVMLFFALIFMFRMRLGKMLAALVILGAGAAIAWHFLGNQETTDTAMRLVSFADTRTAGWRHSWQGFLKDPVFGSLTHQQLLTENSYITVAAYMGFYGLIPLLAAMILTGLGMLKLNRFRRFLGEDTMLADLVIGSFISLAIGAIFEGYFVGMLNLEVYAIYIYLAVMAFILDKMQKMQSWEAQSLQADLPDVGAQAEYEMAEAGYY